MTLLITKFLWENVQVSKTFCIFADEKEHYDMEDKDVTMASEPAAAVLTEEVRQSGLLSQVMKLSQSDKVALIKYLRLETGTEDPFKTDEFGRIALTKEMREAVAQAERDLEAGKCLSESSFKERFAKWL